MSRSLTALLILCAAATVQTAAQDTQATDAYRLTVDRLADRLAHLRTDVFRAESVVGMDTVAVHRFHVLSRPERRDFFRESAALAWESLVTVLGSDTVLVEDALFYFREASDPVLRRTDVTEYFIDDETSPETVALRLLQNAQVRIWEQVAGELQEWLPSPAAFGPLSRTAAQVVYADLVTAPWASTTACFDGNLDACARALALESAERPISLWFTIDEQRRAIRDSRSFGLRLEPDYIACTNGNDASCTALLESRPYLIRTPLALAARGSVLQVAVELGGEGSLGRLVHADSGSVGERLSRAAGVSQDSLVTEWRARILAAEPESIALTRVAGWTAFVWVLVWTIAATRSTRWRPA